MMRWTISKIAAAAGVGVETIRYYERRGLIEQPKAMRTAFREYPESVIARVRFIKRAQELGFTLEEIAELLALTEQSGITRKEVREVAQQKLVMIREKLQDLIRMEATLSKLVRSCSGKGSLAGCPIIEALAESPTSCKHQGE
ncbi:MAG: MerR family DNA-binding protein [Pirellulales bacterium]